MARAAAAEDHKCGGSRNLMLNAQWDGTARQRGRAEPKAQVNGAIRNRQSRPCVNYQACRIRLRKSQPVLAARVG